MNLDSLARLRLLGEIATARRLANLDLTDRLRTVRDEHRRAAERVERLTTGREYSDRAGVEAEVKRLKARIADLDEVIADLKHRQQDASADFNSAKSLEVRCREFATENGLPVPETFIGDGEAYSGGRVLGGLGMVQNGGAA